MKADLKAPGGWYGYFIAPHALLRRDDGRVWFLRRAGTGYRDGWLCPPAGRIEPGEDVLAAAIREAREEAGVMLAAADEEHVVLLVEELRQGS